MVVTHLSPGSIPAMLQVDSRCRAVTRDRLMELQASLGDYLDWEPNIYDILHDPGVTWFIQHLTFDDGTDYTFPGITPWEEETELKLWNYSLELLEDIGLVLSMPEEPNFQDWRLWRMTIALAWLKMSGRLRSLKLDHMFTETNFHAAFLSLINEYWGNRPGIAEGQLERSTAAHTDPPSDLSPSPYLGTSQPDNNGDIASADNPRRPERATAIHTPHSSHTIHSHNNHPKVSRGSWYFEKPLQSLSTLRVTLTEQYESVGYEDILVYLQLPSLQHLEICDAIARSLLLDSHGTHYLEEHSWVLHEAGMGPLQIPSLSSGSTSLTSLKMYRSLLSFQQLQSLNELNKFNTLETIDYDCYHLAGIYIPQKFIKASIKHCEKSLRHINFGINNDYDILWFEEAEEHYTANAAGLYDFSSAALCASFNFASFERLEVLVLPATLLLNGLCPVSILKARPAVAIQSIESKLANWVEPDITALPDLAAVLPSSIRQLGIEVHEFQRDLLRCYLWRQLSIQSPSESKIITLPNLHLVQVLDLGTEATSESTYGEVESLPIYWKRQSDFNLDWRETGTPEIPRVSCKWCGGTNETSLEESGSEM